MENGFAEAVALVGLSVPETAAYLGKSVSTVQSYSTGRRVAPDDVLERIRSLWLVVNRTDGTIDTDGRPIPAGALARRRAIRAAEEWSRFVHWSVEANREAERIELDEVVRPEDDR